MKKYFIILLAFISSLFISPYKNVSAQLNEEEEIATIENIVHTLSQNNRKIQQSISEKIELAQEGFNEETKEDIIIRSFKPYTNSVIHIIINLKKYIGYLTNEENFANLSPKLIEKIISAILESSRVVREFLKHGLQETMNSIVQKAKIVEKSANNIREQDESTLRGLKESIKNFGEIFKLLADNLGIKQQLKTRNLVTTMMNNDDPYSDEYLTAVYSIPASIMSDLGVLIGEIFNTCEVENKLLYKLLEKWICEKTHSLISSSQKNEIEKKFDTLSKDIELNYFEWFFINKTIENIAKTITLQISTSKIPSYYLSLPIEDTQNECYSNFYYSFLNKILQNNNTNNNHNLKRDILNAIKQYQKKDYISSLLKLIQKHYIIRNTLIYTPTPQRDYLKNMLQNALYNED